MKEEFVRTAMVLGTDALEKLQNAKVLVFGVGGVGGYVVEALARSGVGYLELVDNDTVSLSNINRQIIATHKSVGRPKVEVAAERVLDINPDCTVVPRQCFYLPETADQFDFSAYDYIVDAIDTVKGKIEIVTRAARCGTPVISSMGAGNKLDPTRFELADIYKTSVDPLARVMRYELKKRGVKKLKVVYSTEEPRTPADLGERPPEGKRVTPGSLAFVPSAAGLIIAGAVVCDLAGVKG